MKKLFALIIALGMFLTLTACVSDNNDQTPETTGKITDNDAEIDTKPESGESENSDSSESTSTDNENDGGEEDNKIDLSRITNVDGFSEGKAFVRYGDITSDEYRTVYCIDKTGEILFTLENIGMGASIKGFYNGLAAIEMQENNKKVVWLCNEKGEFIKPADVGATSFLVDPSETYLHTLPLFEDGFILVENTVTDFRGSTTKMAVLNADLEIVVDYSEELYELYESFAYSPYYNGYLYDYDGMYDVFGGALNLKTGEMIEDFSAVAGSVEREYPSDLWACKDTYYIDIATGKVTVNLEEYAETIYTTYDFDCGVAPILFRVDNTEFIGIILENGSFAFDPIEIKGRGATVYADGGKILVLSANGNDIYAETFDVSGKLGEITFDPDGYWFNASINDGVVVIADFDTNTKYTLYTVDLQPLFD